MPKIIPFRAIRPTRDKVSLLASRSYESYNHQELESRLRDNPFSFLHILNPGYKYHKEISGEERYQLVRNRFEEFKEDGIFMQDAAPCYYIYKIVNRDERVFHGIVAAAHIADYENDLIKRHEDTLSQRELIFKDYLKTVGFNAESVLLTYPDQPKLAEIISKVMIDRAEYEFTTTYRDTHYVWPVSDKILLEQIASIFNKMSALYIADGHHRSSSSYLLAKELKGQNKHYSLSDAHNYFMCYLIPESDLKIYEFNRLVTDLNGLSTEEFLIQLDTIFRIEERGVEYYKPSGLHYFSMYLEGSFYMLHLRKQHCTFSNALEALDTYILNNQVLKPILGIDDPRNDDRLSYSDGKKDMAYVKSLVDSKQYKVGFGLHPITIEEMKRVADEGLTMPPKSTYIEPKLRSGVTIYEF
jgi:uncharacterized protein (DUF1015 family)